MQSRNIIGLAAAAVLFVGLSGCASTTASNSSAGAKKPLTIGLLIPQGDQYFQGIQTTMEAEAKAAGDTVITDNTNNSASTEASEVQNLITRKVDAIVMQPATSDVASIATMKTVKAAGIPLICYGNCSGDAASPKIVDGIAESNNADLGTATAKYVVDYIKTKLNGTATIAILNCDMFEACQERKAGFKKVVAASGLNVTIVADQTGELADTATPLAANILSAHPTLNLFWSANEGGTEGEVAAVKASGKKVPVFGTDISNQIAQYLLNSDNILQVTTGQDSPGTAKAAFKLALNAINGKVNKPFDIQVPGSTFLRSDPAAVHKYLGK